MYVSMIVLNVRINITYSIALLNVYKLCHSDYFKI